MNNKELDKLLAHEFPVRKNLIYLNHAAVSPLPLRTGDALKAFVDEYVHLGTKNYMDWALHGDQLHTDLAKFINAPSADDIALLKTLQKAFPWSLWAFHGCLVTLYSAATRNFHQTVYPGRHLKNVV